MPSSGEPDAWGSKSIAFLLPVISLVLYVSLTVVSRFPHRFNYPWPITEDNVRTQYAMSRQLLSSLKVSGLGIFGYIVWARLETAMGARQGLGAWFLPATLSLTALIIGVYFARASRAR